MKLDLLQLLCIGQNTSKFFKVTFYVVGFFILIICLLFLCLLIKNYYGYVISSVKKDKKVYLKNIIKYLLLFVISTIALCFVLFIAKNAFEYWC